MKLLIYIALIYGKLEEYISTNVYAGDDDTYLAIVQRTTDYVHLSEANSNRVLVNIPHYVLNAPSSNRSMVSAGPDMHCNVSLKSKQSCNRSCSMNSNSTPLFCKAIAQVSSTTISP
jgi:hypothetical protein